MVATSTERNSLAAKYGTDAAWAALYTTVPSGGAPGTEVAGGSYARQALTWGAPIAGVITVTVTFSVPSGVTVNGAGVHSAASGTGNYLDGGPVSTPVTFSAPGSYTLTLNYTQG